MKLLQNISDATNFYWDQLRSGTLGSNESQIVSPQAKENRRSPFLKHLVCSSKKNMKRADVSKERKKETKMNSSP